MKDRLDRAVGPDFEIIRSLGKGRQGEVFLGREISLDRLVAVKVLRSDLSGNEVARARFEREAKAAAALYHPNAASVHRFGFLPDGTPYLVFQYLRGRTLEERIAAEGSLSVSEARKILRDVAGALAAAHEHGYVHRDVRPGNVMCDRETGRTLLTDFGVAGILPSGEDQGPRLTRAGELLGDMKHMSPEQLDGQDATDASDVYALGVLGYEILAGQGPYGNRRGPDLVSAHLKEKPLTLSTLCGGVDPELETLLARCLAKDPGKRPSADFVTEVLASEPGEKAPAVATEVRSADGDLLGSLVRRRFPQIVVVTAGAGWIGLAAVDQLVDRGLIDGVWYRMALLTFACGVAASAVIAWFHGAKGKQRFRVVEVALLLVVAAAWLVGCFELFGGG